MSSDFHPREHGVKGELLRTEEEGEAEEEEEVALTPLTSSMRMPREAAYYPGKARRCRRLFPAKESVEVGLGVQDEVEEEAAATGTPLCH